MKTVLILDTDLGFVFWLGQALDQAGFTALPARSVVSARELLAELEVEVDVLVVNLQLPGTVDLIEPLRNFHPDLRIIGIMGDGEPVAPPAEVDAWIRKPRRRENSSGWVEVVRGILPGSGRPDSLERRYHAGLSH